jgi:hypothetical protein
MNNPSRSEISPEQRGSPMLAKLVPPNLWGPHFLPSFPSLTSVQIRLCAFASLREVLCFQSVFA